MDILHAIIYGIVEGITEFLPISSTGHLILTSHILGNPQTEFLKSFEIAIQLGAILSVVAIYWRELFVNRRIMKRIIAACIPTAFIGLLFYNIVKNYLMDNVYVVLWALLLGGILIIIFERAHGEQKRTIDELGFITYPQAFLIGVFQSIAIIPGVSRAAATIFGGMYAGLSRRAIVQFSFLLAVPTMAAATGLDLVKTAHLFTPDEFGFLAVGFIVSFAVALGAIKFFLSFVRTHTFELFGIYRIFLALLGFILLAE
jgi:undecaprenyl-diphosphatase